MIQSIYRIAYLLLSLRTAIASPVISRQSAHPPSSHSKAPRRLISVSSPSQYPILEDHTSSSELITAFRGTINISSCGLKQTIPVTYSLSSQVCVPMISGVPYIFNDLSQQLLSEHLDGIKFPLPSYTQTSSLPVYLAANITEQLYRSKYVLSLSLKLSPLDTTSRALAPSHWQSIIALLEQSAEELDRAARKRNGAGLGSVLLLEADIADVGILAEWRFWSVVDGLTVMCES
ncbi:hypothetical protein BKA65DRAFT_471250 [Rhexocercosporidium sp. MPI-PUGE-AT-0058]|nr:hypothetical protein BKA65DRAFT_471250 [Rhexocercosporidium sp. MPI-PUGE-AT-0058]